MTSRRVFKPSGRIQQRDETVYSDRFCGAKGNYRWPVRFDLSGGSYLGISQTKTDGRIERVLLSPAQVRKLRQFLDEGFRP